jgi:hypothetical protein
MRQVLCLPEGRSLLTVLQVGELLWRHAGPVNDAQANEVVLLNSHDGTSSYQLLAGLFRLLGRCAQANALQRR